MHITLIICHFRDSDPSEYSKPTLCIPILKMMKKDILPSVFISNQQLIMCNMKRMCAIFFHTTRVLKIDGWLYLSHQISS